jgi:transcriptional regulator with PAS, ATPase and Fis domain
VAINCAAIPETLLESELFGHDKGAFTGAIERRQGCFELADRGTLFLDEVAEMMAATQVKLLRVLQERTFRRLGGRQEQSVDIRVIAATNVDVAAAVQNGRLREDLYYRLNVFEIRLPPLRERKADLPLLVQAFIKEFNARNGRSIVGVDADVLAAFEQYSWPGNVRELRNVIERATIVAEAPLISMRDLPSLIDHQRAPLILMTLEHTKGNKTHAAEMLDISLKTLHNKLDRYEHQDERGPA